MKPNHQLQGQPPISNKPNKLPNVQNNFHNKSRNHSLKKIPYYHTNTNDQPHSLNSFGMFPKIQQKHKKNNINYKNNGQTSLQKNSVKWYLPQQNHLKKRQKLLTQANHGSQQMIIGDQSFVSLTNKLMATQGDIKDTMIDFRKKIEMNKMFIKKEIERKNKENNESSIKKEDWVRKKRVASSRFVGGNGVVEDGRGQVGIGSSKGIESNNHSNNNNGNSINSKQWQLLLLGGSNNTNNINLSNNNHQNNNNRNNKRTIQTPKSKLQSSLIKQNNQNNDSSSKKKKKINSININHNQNNNNHQQIHRKRQKTQIQYDSSLHILTKQSHKKQPNNNSNQLQFHTKQRSLKSLTKQQYISNNNNIKNQQKSLTKRKSQGLFGQLQVMLDQKIRDDNVVLMEGNKEKMLKEEEFIQGENKLRELLNKLYKHKSNCSIIGGSNNSENQYHYNHPHQYHSASSQLLQQSTQHLLQSQHNSLHNNKHLHSQPHNQWNRLQLQSTSQITYRKSSFQQQLNKISQYAQRNDASLQKYIIMRKQLMKLGFQVNGNNNLSKEKQNQYKKQKDNKMMSVNNNNKRSINIK